jgi:hypothetical protein
MTDTHPIFYLPNVPDEFFVLLPLAVLLGSLLVMLLYNLVKGKFDPSSLRAAYREGKNDAGDP